MKKISIFVLLSFFSSAIFAQNITGAWEGFLEVQGQKLKLVLHISQKDDKLSAKLDSPAQGVQDIPCDTTSFTNGRLQVNIKSLKASYSGELKHDTITGQFTQMGYKIPLNLTRQKEHEKTQIYRPQEPQKPFPYYTEEVVFKNESEQNKLTGTLTLPNKNGQFPAVILINGSGQQNRDEEIMGHKPFLVISDYLTRNGISVLRYDDRGIGGSTGDVANATSENFASDVEAAVRYLRTRHEVKPNKIGLIGHSEGGIIAPMVAVKDNKIAFIVLLAAPGIRGKELLELQTTAILKKSGMPDNQQKIVDEMNSKAYKIVLESNENSQLKEKLSAFLDQTIDTNPEVFQANTEKKKQKIKKPLMNQLTSPWMQFFIKYDPTTTLTKVSCPVFAINGSLDMQVTPKENLSGIENALKIGHNEHYTIKEIKGVNHLFQECTSGAPVEYGKITQTFSPKTLFMITEWIKTTTH